MIFDTEVEGTVVANVTVIDPVDAWHVTVVTEAFVSGVSVIAATAQVDGNVNFTCVNTPELAASVIFTSAAEELITLRIKALPAQVPAPRFAIPVNSSDDNLKASVRVETGVITISSSQAVVAVTP